MSSEKYQMPGTTWEGAGRAANEAWKKMMASGGFKEIPTREQDYRDENPDYATEAMKQAMSVRQSPLPVDEILAKGVERAVIVAQLRMLANAVERGELNA